MKAGTISQLMSGNIPHSSTSETVSGTLWRNRKTYLFIFVGNDFSETDLEVALKTKPVNTNWGETETSSERNFSEYPNSPAEKISNRNRNYGSQKEPEYPFDDVQFTP